MEQSQQTVEHEIAGAAGHNLIDRLPNELLLEIFLFHIFTNYGSLIELLLVCKRWQTICSPSSLWTSICYGPPIFWKVRRPEEEPGWPTKGMIHCSTPERLEQAIRKAKSAKFELTINANLSQLKRFQDLTTTARKAISNNCRSMKILTTYCLDQAKTRAYEIFLFYLADIPLRALEEFVSIGSGDILNTSLLAKNLQRNSPHLQSLSTLLFESWNDYPQLLPRITKLSVAKVQDLFYNRAASIGTFDKVEELTLMWERFQVGTKGLKDPLPMPALKRVTINTGYIYKLPIEFYAQLTHLTLAYCEFEENKLEAPLCLPLLTYLHIQGSWGLFAYLEALNLVTLRLHGECTANPQGSKVVACILKSTLLPKILDIHKTISRDHLTKFVSRIGAKLEELSIIHVRQDDTICKQLVSALVGGKRKQPICPLLRKLETITPRFGPDSKELYETTEQRLRQVIDARSSNGVLSRVRNGYYHLANRDIGDQKWWSIEWEELLWV